MYWDRSNEALHFTFIVGGRKFGILVGYETCILILVLILLNWLQKIVANLVANIGTNICFSSKSIQSKANTERQSTERYDRTKHTLAVDTTIVIIMSSLLLLW